MKLIISHNSGFFSCNNIKLHYIIKYFNQYKKLPNEVDTKDSYGWYKNDDNEDITYHYFKHYNGIPETIEYTREIDFNEWYQSRIYTKLDYEGITPFINKYFSPSDRILKIIQEMEIKYNLDYNNIVVLFFRGNDKSTEVPQLPSYEEYIYYGELILKKNPNIKFLIQSDETNFILTMEKHFPNNNIIFRDEIRHIQDRTTTVDKINRKTNLKYSLNYLAITIIISKCSFIICNSGNCSLWIVLYRGNANNLILLDRYDFV